MSCKKNFVQKNCVLKMQKKCVKSFGVKKLKQKNVLKKFRVKKIIHKLKKVREIQKMNLPERA